MEAFRLTKEIAISVYHTQWWQEKTAYQQVRAQLFTQEPIMPFDLFHGALEEVLKRPVWTHEFGLNIDGIREEFLGEQEPPSLEEIFNLVPEEKRLIIIMLPGELGKEASDA